MFTMRLSKCTEKSVGTVQEGIKYQNTSMFENKQIYGKRMT